MAMKEMALRRNTLPDAGMQHDEATDHRADAAGDIGGNRIGRNCLRYTSLGCQGTGDHHPRRLIKTLQRRIHDRPAQQKKGRNCASDDQKPDDTGICHGQNLRQPDQSVGIAAVGHGPGKRRDPEGGDQVRQSDRADPGGRMRQLPNQPADGCLLHPVAREADTLCDRKQDEVAALRYGQQLLVGCDCGHQVLNTWKKNQTAAGQRNSASPAAVKEHRPITGWNRLPYRRHRDS